MCMNHDIKVLWYADFQSRPMFVLLRSRVSGQCHPQRDGPDITKYQTTTTPMKTWHQQMKEDMMGDGCYPGCGPIPEGVEKKDKAYS